MSQNDDPVNPFDPLGLMKGMRDAGMDAWSKSMIQLVNSDAYAQASAVMLNTWLAHLAPLHKAMATAITQALTSVNMPTREDVTSLANRLTNIEMRLDDMEALLEEIRSSPRKASAHKSRASNGGTSQ